MKNTNSIAGMLGTLVGAIIKWFLSAFFIYWGYGILAERFNLPQFTYMEVFAIRMAASSIMNIFWSRTSANIIPGGNEK